jgi:hypothetical protein
MNTYIYALSRGKSLDMGDIFVKAKPCDKLMTLYELAKRHIDVCIHLAIYEKIYNCYSYLQP